MTGFKIPTGVLAQHVIALGKTRSGKSSKVRVLVEQLLKQKKPVCIVDVKGDWYGLKSSADGKSAGFPIVIFGGRHADVPINARSGAGVAELVATGNRPAIIDLKGWTITDRTNFFIDFAERFYSASVGTRHLVIPEVHNFCPKGKVFSPQAGMMLHWANTLATEGQGLGIILIADSQRPQKVHNDFLTNCETLIACRVIHKADRDAVKDWVDGCADPERGKAMIAELANMPRTDAWVWSPEIDFGPERLTWPMFETFDSFKPRDNSAHADKLKGWAEVDLVEVTAKLGAAIKEAHANDPAALKKRIAELERQAKLAPAANQTVIAAVAQENLNEAHQIGFAEGRDRGWKDCAELAGPYLTGLVDHNESFLDKVEHIVKLVTSTPKFEGAPATKAPHVIRPKPLISPVKTPVITRKKNPHDGNGSSEVSGLQRKVLNALAWLDAKGIERPSRQMVAAVAGVKPGTGYYTNTLGAMRTAELIAYPEAGTVMATDLGRSHADSVDARGEVHEQWMQILSGLEREIVSMLVSRHPHHMTREDLAGALGKQPGTGYFTNTLGHLRTLGAIDYPAPGRVNLTRYVMP